MIPEVIIAALIVAWVLGGRPDRLADAPIKHVWLVGVPVLMYAVSWAASRWTVFPQGSWIFGALQLAGLASLIFLCAVNRKIPGAILIGIGVALNAIAIASNGGFMPASKDAVAAAFGQDYLHRALSEEHFRRSFMTADTRLWWLCDIIPKSIGPTIWRGAYSIGDMVMSLGVFIGIVGLSHVPKLSRRGARDLNGSKAGERTWLCWAGLAGIILLAAALRFAGLRWGLPNELHSYSYHPDEFLTIGSSARVAGLLDGHRTIDPGLYNYPSLYLYISALAMIVANGYGWLGNLANVYLTARVVTALMGLGAVGATYWAGRVMFGSAVGLLAALVLAIAPLHVQHSHFATVDVPSTVFVALCLGFSGLILKRGSWRDYILAGVMAGLAGGTKYNAVLVIFAPMAAHFLSSAHPLSSAQSTPSPLRERVGVRVKRWNSTILRIAAPRLWLIPACAIAAFVISTPGSVLHTSQLLGGIGYEMRHQAVGHGLVFVGTGNGFVYTLRSSLWYGMGPALAVSLVIAVVSGLCRRNRTVMVLMAFTVPYYVLISLSEVRFARYTLPLYPAAALLVGYLICDWYGALERLWKPSRLVLISVAIFWGFTTLVYTGMVTSALSAADPRDKAAMSIKESIPRDSSIGFVGYPWYYSPPITNDIGFGTLPQRREATRKASYNITIFSEFAHAGDWWVQGHRPDWVVLTPEETRDAERLRGRIDIPAGDRRAVDRTLEDIGCVRQHYLPGSSGRPPVPGFGNYKWYLWPYGALPHDMRYALSNVEILRLKK